MLAVIDSGVGGLSVWIEVKKLLRHNSLLYYADTANCPYGTRTKEEIKTLTTAVVEKVTQQGVQIVVVACNTMTASSIDVLRRKWKNIDFVGMEPAVKPAAQSSKSGVVGILATQATLKGELYHHTRSVHASTVKIIETAGDGLVECVEKEEQNSARCLELLKKYITPIIEQGADTLVLGCTHYPFLTDAIERVASDIFARQGISDRKLNIINPAPAVARRVVELAHRRGIVGQDIMPTYEFQTSGDKDDLTRLKNLSLNIE